MKNFCLANSFSTEITENNEGGWILFDADCRFCQGTADRFGKIFSDRGFTFLPLQTPWVIDRLGLDAGTPLEEMRVLTQGGADYGGADAVIFLARKIWWARPFYLLAQLAGMHRIVDRGYRWIAARHGCTHLACAVPRERMCLKWSALLLLPVAAVLARNHIAPWAFMWLMTAAIFFGCKWLTFWSARNRHTANLGRVIAYFIAWPGMNAADFLAPRTRREIPPLTETGFVFAKILFGAALLFALARQFNHPLLVGWIGMMGLIFILHFGLFHLAAIVWRAFGVRVDPIMDAPWRATSLTEFWGRRWNDAFNRLTLENVFRPLAHSLGTTGAMLVAFLFSGIVHESVISLPAAAGYGLPTAYFLLQGCGVILERSSSRIRGRIFTLLVVAAPAFWLFHPPFVRAVVLPFMKAIGAL